MSDHFQQAPSISVMTVSAPFALRRETLDAIAGRVETVLNGWKLSLLALFCIFYLAATCYRASTKLFWFDEIFTVYLSRLPDLKSLWDALAQGVDFNPPLFYLLTKAGEGLLGAGQVGARLPEIVGVGVFCLCLFRFVSIRSSVLGGLVAMLFPLVTNAYWYAYEARPHGVVLGCCGIALVCWQQAAALETERRFWWLVGLGVALAGALLNHAYAALLFVPLAMGELARLVILRRIDWPMWVTFLLASSALAVVIPLVRLAAAMLTGFGAFSDSIPPSIFLDSYRGNLGPAVIVIAWALALLCLPPVARPRHASRLSPAQAGPVQHEIVVLCGLIAIPVFAAVVSLLTKSPLFDRYSLSFVAGFAGLLGLAAARRPIVGIVILALLFGQIAVDQINYVRKTVLLEPSSLIEVSTHKPHFMRRYRELDAFQDKSVPIVVLDDLEFAPMAYYAPPYMVSRMTYVVWASWDIVGPFYRRLKDCCNSTGTIVNAADFFASHDKFLVYGKPRSMERVKLLIDAGAKINMLNMSSDHFLAFVTFQNQQDSPSSGGDNQQRPK